ncbi:MAG: HAD family phosphatase [candidate division Zixibacteria bacterium]|nr:HAD family phosphatase [candidate division Zixibacteria bacterium]
MSASAVVFWDIDGTLVRGSLERLFLKYLLQQEHVTRIGTAANVLLLALYFPPPKSYQIKLAYLRNQKVGEVETWIQRCWDESIKQNLFDGARQVITQLANTGARQVLLSGTLKPLASPLMTHLGIDEIIAAEPEIVNQRYSGRLIEPHPHGEYKALYAERWLAANDLSWDRVVALANHGNDRYLLKKASRAIAVHPDQKLRQIAKHQDWPIANNLKDVAAYVIQ